jgi:DNA excision repair protein ERCC-8
MRSLLDRSVLGGPVSSRRTTALFRENRMRFLDISRQLEIRQSPDQEGPVTILDIDKISDNMLLSGGKDCSISIFNLECSNKTLETHNNKFENPAHKIITPVSHIKGRKGGTAGGHEFAVTSVQWYPIDNGCFISGGHDGVVKIWATESTQMMKEVKCAQHVYCAKMPPAKVGGSHCLIAVATNEGETQLIDIRAGCAIQRLGGHDGGVWSLDWSPTNEFMLATGGKDGAVRVFDIRQHGDSACRACLDQYMAHGLPEEGAPYLPEAASSDMTTRSRHWWGLNQTAAPVYVRTRVRNKVATAHTNGVHAVCFSPDGRYLVTSAAGEGLKLWDMTTSQPSVCPVVFSHALNQVTEEREKKKRGKKNRKKERCF